MKPFTTLVGVAAPLRLSNVNTDMIIPVQFCNVLERAGCAEGLFYNLRHREDGSLQPEFVLNKAAYRHASILISGDNFGCGSSREHAPWALLESGIRCVIAPSFADIFQSNCLKNGILPIALPHDEIDVVMDDSEAGANALFKIDLFAQTIERPDGCALSFDVDPIRKRFLLEGLDDIQLTLTQAETISRFEAANVPVFESLGNIANALRRDASR